MKEYKILYSTSAEIIEKSMNVNAKLNFLVNTFTPTRHGIFVLMERETDLHE